VAKYFHKRSTKVPQKVAFLEVPFFSGSSTSEKVEVFWNPGGPKNHDRISHHLPNRVSLDACIAGMAKTIGIAPFRVDTHPRPPGKSKED
jgi:hypothetical protein